MVDRAGSTSRGDDWLALVRAGDESAWRQIFDSAFPRLFRTFRARGTARVAQELATDVLIDAHRSRDRSPGEDAARVGEWLFGLARETFERHQAELAGPLLKAEDLRQGYVREQHLTEESLQVLRHLPSSCRVALELRYVLGLSSREAAAFMQRSPLAFRTLLARATHEFERATAGF
jgi:DNA-directed RNA polymerase specialized sigma24 family protein